MWIEEHHTKKGIKYKYFERYKDPVMGNNKRVSVTMESNSTQDTKLATYTFNRWPMSGDNLRRYHASYPLIAITA